MILADWWPFTAQLGSLLLVSLSMGWLVLRAGRRKREEPGTRKVTSLERKVLAEMDRITDEYAAGNEKLVYNPALIDRIYYDEKFLVLSGHGIERWIKNKNDPECQTPTPSEEPDPWPAFHRDCLDINMNLDDFVEKWHGKVPKKPAPPTDWAPPETSDARKARKKFIFDYGALTPLERKVMGADPATLLPFMYTPPPSPRVEGYKSNSIHLMSPNEWALYETGWKCTCGRGHEAPMRREA